MEARGKRTVSAEQAELLRQIPSVDELLAQPQLAALSKRTDRNLVVEVARAVLADLRARIAVTRIRQRWASAPRPSKS